MSKIISEKRIFLQGLDERSATIGIVGLGYIGLPFVVAFAEAGFKVIGLDLNAEKLPI